MMQRYASYCNSSSVCSSSVGRSTQRSRACRASSGNGTTTTTTAPPPTSQATISSSSSSSSRGAEQCSRRDVAPLAASRGAEQCGRRDVLLLAAGLLATPQSAAEASVPELSVPGQLGPFSLQAPEAVRFPRKALNLKFAILLMRSGFDAVDQLNFVSMDQFQKNFWLLRQSQLEGYNLAYAPLRMRNGDLTDPLYADFISFAQFATISQELGRPQTSFQEYVEVCPPGAGEDDPCDGATQLVTRPPQFADDARLADYFYQTAGDLMLQRLRDGFQGWQSGAPPPPAKKSMQELTCGVQQLLDAMLGGGYALSATASCGADTPPNSFSVAVVGPCSLWSVQALRARNARVLNIYDACIIAAWLRAGGRAVRSCEITQTASGWSELWTVA